MNTPITPWINLTLHQAQRCHHLAWFLYGCLEREHRLNVHAFVAWWLVRPLARRPRSQCLRPQVEWPSSGQRGSVYLGSVSLREHPPRIRWAPLSGGSMHDRSRIASPESCRSPRSALAVSDASSD